MTMTTRRDSVRVWLGAVGAFGLLTLIASTAGAGGFALAEQSVVAGGTGGAGTARSADPAAAWYNPAALADGGGLKASAGILLALPSLSAHALDGGWDQETESSLRTPPHLYLAYARGPWAAGLSFNVPFGSGVSWPEQWRGRYEIVSSSLQVFRLAPFFAWRFGRVRVSAGFFVDMAKLEIRRNLDFVDQDGKVALDLSDVGFGGHGAVYVDVHSMLSLGASYKSRTRLGLEGTARFDAPLAFSDKAFDQHASAAGMTLPDLISIGAEFRPHRRVKAMLDLGVTIWSIYERLYVDFESDKTTDSEQVNQWETSVSVRGGAEVKLLRWLTGRAGLFYDPSPVPTATLAPNSPDSNRLGVTTGLGADLPWGLSFDLFYAYVHFLGQPSDNDENLRAEYDGRLHMIGIGLRYMQR
jgi:long-chain fatty acid transport protein